MNAEPYSPDPSVVRRCVTIVSNGVCKDWDDGDEEVADVNGDSSYFRSLPMVGGEVETDDETGIG